MKIPGIYTIVVLPVSNKELPINRDYSFRMFTEGICLTGQNVYNE